MQKKSSRTTNQTRSKNPAGVSKKTTKPPIHHEDKIQNILGSIEDGYYEIDLAGNFTFFNDALCRIHGRSRKELMGLNYKKYLNEENIELLFEAYNKVYKTGKPNKQLGLQATRKDETIIYIEISISLRKDSSGQPIGFSGIVRDVTDHMQAEASLRQSEEKYRLLADHMKDAVWITDLNLKVTYASPSAEKLIGWTQEEIIQLPLDKLLTPESLMFAFDFYAIELPAAIAAPPDYILERSLELEFVTKDGQTLWGECMFSLVRDEMGNPIAILGESRNITERKQMEQKLQVSESNFRHSLDESPLGVRITSIAGDTVYANKAILNMYGYSSIDELINIPLKERYTPESYTASQERRKKRLNGKFVDPEYEVSIVRKTGEVRHLHLFRKEIFWDGKKHYQVIYDDITERKRAEEELKKSEALYRLLADNITEHIWIMDLNLNLTYISPSVEKVYGYTVDEIKKLKLKKLFNPESYKKIKDIFAEKLIFAMNNPPPPLGTRLVMELEAYHRDGHKIWIENRLSFIRDANGKPVSIMGETRDITDRKLAQEALKKSEEQYRLLADHMKDQVWLMDLNMRITYVSPSVERLTGYSSEEIQKMPLDKILTPDSLKRAIEFTSVRMPKAMKESSKDSIFRTIELEFILKNGQTVWGECSFNFIRNENGKVVSILGEARDITERKKMEEKLLEEEKRFRALAEQSSDIIITLNKEGLVTYENPAARILGIIPEERVGASVFEYVHPDDLKLVTDAFLILFSDANAPVQKAELRLRHRDGSWRTFEAIASSLVRDNVIEAAIVNLRDITERKKDEEKLQQTLESLKKAVGTTIQVLVSALESRDPYTAGHQSRSANLACAIATEMGLNADKIEGIHMAGIIHDIGKLSIPAEILSKPTKLTHLEFSLIKIHPQSGYEMLKDIESPWPLAEIVHQHHERLNGTGYPRNLKNDEILMEARIMAVADVVEAMASHRPYRASLGIEEALDEIEKNRGILYDATVVDACLNLFRNKGYQLS